MRRILRFKVRLFYALVMLVAAVKILVFAAAIYAENNLENVTRWASDMVGTPVHIERIQTSWLSLVPTLRLSQLRLGDKEQLDLGDAQVSLRVTALPNWRSNLPINITLSGTKIHLLRDASGKTRLIGLNASGGKQVSLPAYVRVKNASLLWEDYKHKPVKFTLKQLDTRLITNKGQSQLSLATADNLLYIRADIQNFMQNKNWGAQVYIKTNALDISPYLQDYMPKNYAAEQFNLSIQAWSQWQSGMHISTQARLEIDGLQLQDDINLVGRLNTDLLYKNDQQSWQLQLADFNWSGENADFEHLMIDLKGVNTGQQKHYQLAINALPLEQVLAVTETVPFADDIQQAIVQLEPSGTLRNLQGTWHDIDDWQFNVDFDNYSQQFFNKLPQLTNFSGSLEIHPDQLSLKLDTHDASIYLTPLFRDPILLGELQGDVLIDWQDKNNWQIKSSSLTAENQDLKTHSRLAINALANEPLWVDLQTDFHAGDAASTSTYLPVAIMSPSLVDWLDEAIVKGDITQGSFLLQGPMGDFFPYDKTHNGHFEVLFDVANVQLDYFAGWPSLTEMAANIRFHNNSLSINAERGKIFESTIVQAQAQIPRLNPSSAIQVKGQVLGVLEDQIRILQETPLKDQFANKLLGIKPTGKALLTSDFSIPLKQHQEFEFSGKLKFMDSSLLLGDVGLDLQRINGTLNMGSQGISSDKITAHALATNVEISIQSADNGDTVVQTQGNFTAEALMNQFPWLAGIPASGKADARLQISIPNSNDQNQKQLALEIWSALEGMELSLPQPLGKTKTEIQSLYLSLPLNAKQTRISVDYADILSLDIVENENSGLEIKGKLTELPLADWISFFDVSSMSEAANKLHPQQIDLQVGYLDYGLLQVDQLHFTANKSDHAWQGKLDSEQLKGSFFIPHQLQFNPIHLTLEQLTLTSREDTQQSVHDKNAIYTGISPAQFPALNFSCRDLQLDQQSLGTLNIVASKEQNTLKLDKIAIAGGQLGEITAYGEWVKQDDSQTTTLVGKLQTKNVAQVASLFSDEIVIHSADSELDFDFHWQGAPWSFSKNRLKGELNLDITEGSFTKLKPGFGRLLGLINFQSLERRLKLNFKDVTHEGLGFNNIQGSIRFDEGHLYTNNLSVDAPSSGIKIAGNIDLDLELMDLLVSVSPRMDAALPVAGAVVGGPVTGLAVLIAQQVMSSKLEEIQRVRYTVQGAWDDPGVEKLKANEWADTDEHILNQ